MLDMYSNLADDGWESVKDGNTFYRKKLACFAHI
jgi:hypothetical protein